MDRPGLGWLLTGLAVTGGLIAVLIGTPQPSRPVARTVWAAAALALVAVGAIRAADWLFVLCLLTACLVAAVAVAGGRTAVGIVLAVPLVAAATLRAVPWLRRGLRTPPSTSPPSPGPSPGPTPGSGSGAAPGGQERPGGNAVLRIAIAGVVGIGLLCVFGALFSAADPAFAAVVSAILPDLHVTTLLRWLFLGGAVAGVTAGGALLLTNPARYADVRLPARRPLRRIEWALPVGLLVGLFAVFVGVQAAVLFGGRGYVLRTSGLTFAEYARRGFWQLLVVTMMTLVVIAFAARVAGRVQRADRILIRVLLGGLTAGALVVVASAMSRMWVYEQAYGFTQLRIFVSAFELWLGALLVLVLVAGVRLRADWLPRAVLGAWVLTLLGLAVLNPDRFVAARNVDRYERTGSIDVPYLRALSADAAPELRRLPAPLRDCALGAVAERLRTDPDEWYAYNAARSAAAARLRHLTDPGFYHALCMPSR